MATNDVSKKNNTKGKTNTVKKEVKKNTVKNEKKEVVKTEKVKKEHKILNAIKKFFNNPYPLFLAFIAIIVALLLYINKCNTESKIYIGTLSNDDVQITNVHYFANNDMNYFYSSTAIYSGEYKNKKVYNYEIGYYVVNNDKEYVPFITRTNKLTSPVEVSTLFEEMSAWNVGELSMSPVYFTSSVKPYLSNLHFVFKGSTDKDSDEADVVVDYEINMSKITKN